MIDLFLKLLNERHNELKSKVAHLIKALASEDLGTKKESRSRSTFRGRKPEALNSLY